MIPIKQLEIIKELESRFWNITRDNGYSSDIERVVVSRYQEWGSSDIPAIVFHCQNDLVVESDIDSVRRVINVIAECHTTLYDEDNITSKAYELMYDMMIAINRETTSPHVNDNFNNNLSGLCDYITEADMQPFKAVKNSMMSGVTIEFQIYYTIDTELKEE